MAFVQTDTASEAALYAVPAVQAVSEHSAVQVLRLPPAVCVVCTPRDIYPRYMSKPVDVPSPALCRPSPVYPAPYRAPMPHM